ncbi:L-lactate dehydrogenase [Alteracholeplasma palmae J233]|uniref:L-lactate dehydrogenase n=1 Tax=Alteracholeplasma palmae (strain ATCC 49389 / J233) TaxID=1318466 RepID=U4KRV9_ALTPJ|nr:L-lactate dehydrogenase [Alteracholeplasma palmae]CCV64486.1 L-lactate dehydrogenase [Alteracholeplasma palmae J233]
MSKISIIGAGAVGAATAFSIMLNKVASDIVLVDINKDRAEGEVMDIFHGTSLVAPVEIKAGEVSDTKDSDIVIITAGLAQKPGETRLDLVNKNIAIYNTLIPEIAKYNPNAILLVVSNPVDILTYITYKLSGFPKNRVIGSGTVLDTARFRSALAREFFIDSRNVHANIIGEHGDSEIAVWSRANVGGLTLDEYCAKEGNCEIDFEQRITDEVKHAAYEIIKRKGFTNYAVAVAVTRICTAILRDEKSILTTSSYLEGHYGTDDIYLSVPSIIGENGIEEIIEIPLAEEELTAFKNSAKIIKDIINKSNLQ